MRLRSSQAHPAPLGPSSLTSTERAQRREQQAAAYVEAIRLRTTAQRILFEANRIAGDIGLSTWVPVFDQLGPSSPTMVCQVNLKPRLVKSMIEIPSRRVQPPARPRGEKNDPQPNSERSAKSEKAPKVGTRKPNGRK
ncbi:hypothetical protein LWI28_012879 [Acer negundo]|uniref:Uncharacterized protein n=1 Tax=Acer negundo TaxID=4023 RepID=A0AAD5P0K2_ACENE|nr:hypothetical protein LWI28_012879 [Acer negundo]